jgi:Putative beta-barrel porin-2, OmpL-like. bbp2
MRPILTAIALLGFASRGFAQEGGDSATPRKLAITGFAEVSYAYTSRGDADAIVGRLYDRFHDEFVLNALTLTLDMPHDAATLSAGAHAEVVYGQNASVIKSAGFDLGEQADAPQLFVTPNVPTADGHGVQIKLGRVPTLMGLEVIETPSNPNWSEGNQFIYVENFTNTGLSVEHKFSDPVDAQLRMFNGGDLVKDNNTRKSFMGRVGGTRGKPPPSRWSDSWDRSRPTNPPPTATVASCCWQPGSAPRP